MCVMGVVVACVVGVGGVDWGGLFFSGGRGNTSSSRVSWDRKDVKEKEKKQSSGGPRDGLLN